MHQSDFIPNFKYQAKSDLERAKIDELCEMAIHKQQVASLLANMYNKNYPCDLSFCLGYTRGGTYLLEAFFWLFEKCTSKEIGDVLWYLAALSQELGLELQDIAEQNILKLQSRKDRGLLSGSGDNR